MILVIIFLGIIAIAEAGLFIINSNNQTVQKSMNLVTEQLGREREMYNEDRKQFEKELNEYKEARDLWAKKYFELEILLKKYETGVAKED